MTFVVEVTVVPNSKRFAITNKDGKAKIHLRSVPENNKANIELTKELTDALGCSVRIISGLSSRRKKLELATDEATWIEFLEVKSK